MCRIGEEGHRVRGQPEHDLGCNETDIQRGADGECAAMAAAGTAMAMVMPVAMVMMMVVWHSKRVCHAAAQVAESIGFRQ
jgi:hypothetical protein